MNTTPKSKQYAYGAIANQNTATTNSTIEKDGTIQVISRGSNVDGPFYGGFKLYINDTLIRDIDITRDSTDTYIGNVKTNDKIKCIFKSVGTAGYWASVMIYSVILWYTGEEIK